MKEILRLVFVLTAISAVAGVMLAFTNKVTREPIAVASQKQTVEGVGIVLPAFDNRPDSETCMVSESGTNWTFYIGRKGGHFVGAAFITSSSHGYGGIIKLLVGVKADHTVKQIQILSQQETPGLGMKVAESAFKDQFQGRSIDGTKWYVKKDGGDVDAITGATISSRAVTEAIRAGLEIYQKHRAEIERPGVR